MYLAIELRDLNMTCDTTIFRRGWKAWQDAFSILGFGLGDTFNTRRIGLRIDHVLVDKRHWHVRSCRIGPDLKEQYRPVIAELLLFATLRRLVLKLLGGSSLYATCSSTRRFSIFLQPARRQQEAGNITSVVHLAIWI
jgi:hypothetical protein